MEKPKVFVNKINKEFNNNKNEYYFRGNEEVVDVNNRINDMFNSSDFVYKNKVEITLKNNKKIVTDVIALRNNELVTLNGNKINKDDIINIKKAF